MLLRASQSSKERNVAGEWSENRDRHIQTNFFVARTNRGDVKRGKMEVLQEDSFENLTGETAGWFLKHCERVDLRLASETAFRRLE